MIVPGFVNCHSHLEYAVYAGFGDGQPFSSWIGLHVERKGRLDLDEMRAIATDGAFECLRSGITTVGDCSFAGAAAEAAAVAGIRAVVYLEVFGADASALERFEELHGRVSHLASERLVLGISPHAPYTCTRELYEACAALGLPQATHLAESVAEREFLVDGIGDWSAFAHMLVPPPGVTGIRMLADAGLLGPSLHGSALRPRGRRGDRAARRARVGVAHCPRSNGYPRLRRRAGRRAPGGGDRGGHRDRQPRVDAVVRPVRRAPDGDRRRARPRAARPDGLTAGDALELATLGGARVLGMDARGRLARRRESRRTSRSSRSPTARSSLLKILSRPSVLGGSPERVAATLVAGEDRYRRGTTAWPDSRRAARRARSRMLR